MDIRAKYPGRPSALVCYTQPHCIGSHATLAQVTAFAESLERHIDCFRDAATFLEVPPLQARDHDKSKWSPEEFPAYAAKFQSGGSPVDAPRVSDDFARAWLHHIHHNPHHWQHWIFSDGYTPDGSTIENGVMEMPHAYVLEMVADWMGASVAYTGSDDMAGWLAANLPKIRLHTESARRLREVLDHLGYADIVYVVNMAHE